MNMRVAIVIYYFTDLKGGVERYTFTLAKGLVNSGIETHVFARKWSVSEMSLPISFHKVPTFAFYSAFKVLTFARNSAKMLKEDNFDVINGFGRTWYQDVYRVGGGCHEEYLKQTHPGMKNPIVRFFIMNNPRNAAIISTEKKTFKKGNYLKIVCNSQKSRREIQEYYSVPDSDIEIIYNGVDTERFCPETDGHDRVSVRAKYGFSPDDFVLLFAGTGFERKGLKHAIDMASLLRTEKRPVKLIVAGKGNAGPYRAQANKLKMVDTVYFVGWKDDMRALYRASDALVLPTLYDSFANVCLEAMACGLPVLTTEQNGVCEIIDNGSNGFVLSDPSEVEVGAKRLLTLFDPEKKSGMSSSSRDTALKYSTSRNLENVISLYKRISEIKKAGGNR